mmetsp:Transcript_15644/g.27281  ORF Transcript_15644/g.27281 Transcript_15644/m.27281 type:complete len:806 (-) Transcript_15644:1313-3730(-)
MGCTQSAEAVPTPANNANKKPFQPQNTRVKKTKGVKATDVEIHLANEDTNADDATHSEKKLIRVLSARRRGEICVESIDHHKKKSHSKPLVEKSETLTQFLLNTLQQNILFRHLSKGQMQQMLNALQTKSVKAKTQVIKQGERGDLFYLVESGDFSFVVDGQPTGGCVAGDSFGELALLYNCPRAATVQCTSPAVVWYLERSAFREIVAVNEEEKRNEVRGTLQKVPLLAKLNADQLNLISDAVVKVHFKAGETIIKKNTKGKIFYMIRSGKVKCARAGSNGDRNELILGEGDYFGERSLMKQEPRAADVIAVTDTDCLVLDRESFNALLGPLTEVLDFNLGMRVIRSVPLFSQLSSQEKNKLGKSLKVESFKKGDVIIKQNDTGSKFYLIRDGTARVNKLVEGVENGAEVASLSPGDYFGEGALLKDEPRTANVVAESDEVVCLTMDRKKFEKLLGPLQKILKRELDTRDDQMVAVVKEEVKKVEDSLKLSDLKLLKTLGTGTFGRVKFVECEKLKRTYALKILQKSQVVAYRQQQNVMNEKEILLACDHPFILRLYRTFKDKNSLYLLLELVLGGELFTLLHIRGGSLPDPDTRFYTACVVDGLEYLHQRKIVYRDLKPENLMIDAEGYIKIVDFGFAKKVEDKTYTLCGTPEYLAPELVLGKGHNKAVDCWAIGILIFEMFTSSSPFADHSGGDHMVICKNIVRGKVDYPKRIPDKARDLVCKLLTRDAHLRLGSQKNGTTDIKEHPWLKTIDYNELRRKRIKAPWIPPIKDSFDTSNFDEYPEDDTIEPYTSNGSNWDEKF